MLQNQEADDDLILKVFRICRCRPPEKRPTLIGMTPNRAKFGSLPLSPQLCENFELSEQSLPRHTALCQMLRHDMWQPCEIIYCFDVLFR